MSDTYTPSQLASEVQTLAENYRGAVNEIEEDNAYFSDIGEAIIAKDGGNIPDKSEMAGRIEAIPAGSDFDMTVTDNQVKMIIEVDSFDLSYWTRFGISGGGTVTVDWGDGTVETYTGNTGLDYAPQRKHNYQEAGEYLVTETVENGVLTIGCVGSYSTLSEGPLLNNPDINSGDPLRWTYNSKLKRISFGDEIIVKNGLAYIPFVTIESEIAFRLSYLTTNQITIKNGMTEIQDYYFDSLKAESVKIAPSISKIRSNAFQSSAIRVIDFTDIELDGEGNFPITVTSPSAFNYMSNSTILLFKTQEIAEVAKTTTNLSQLASQIKYVGEV